MELETLKTYIKTYLKTEFIQSFKSPEGISIPFNKKFDSNICLCINYEDFNNLTIENQYLLALIDKFFD